MHINQCINVDNTNRFTHKEFLTSTVAKATAIQTYPVPLQENVIVTSRLYASAELPRSSKVHMQVIFEHA